jgi:hypothetical protein
MANSKKPASPMTFIAEQINVTTPVSTVPKFGIDSPEMLKLFVTACEADDKSKKAWFDLSGALYKNGVRADQLEIGTTKQPNKAYDKPLVEKLFRYCAEYLSKSEREILFADKSSLTADQLKDKRKLQVRINEKMAKIRDYLKNFNDVEIGANKKIPLGDALGDVVQTVIDRIQRAKSENINFRMVESLTLARMLKNALKNMPNPDYDKLSK